MAASGFDGAREVESLEAAAFATLYPHEYMAKFLDAGVRPDGRRQAQARALSVDLGTLVNVQGSALVKLGRTTVVAGIKLEVMQPSDGEPERGAIDVSFEFPPLCGADFRPGKPVDEAASIAERVARALETSGACDLSELNISSGRAAWCAYIDMYCLDDDGGLLDAALLAAVCALRDLRIPSASLGDDGRVCVDDKGKGRTFNLASSPLSLTCGLYKGHVLTDPSRAEEALLEAAVTVVVDDLQPGRVLGVHRAGGHTGMDDATLVRCVQAALVHHSEVLKKAIQ